MRAVRCIFVACLLSLSLSGCVSLSEFFAMFGGGHDDGADLPTYRVGDAYTYGSPSVTWRVVDVADERVTWRSNWGDEQVTGRNPLLPALGWQSERLGNGQRMISDKVGSLFPMKVGARTTFRAAVTTSKPPYGWSFDWQCEVLDRQEISGPNGILDTYKVGCGRDAVDEMIFFYAPSIGHYVTKTDRPVGDSAGRVRHLVAFERISDDGRLERTAFSPEIQTSNRGYENERHGRPSAAAQPTLASKSQVAEPQVSIERLPADSGTARSGTNGGIEQQARRLLSRQKAIRAEVEDRAGTVLPRVEDRKGSSGEIATVERSMSATAGPSVGDDAKQDHQTRFALVELRTPDFPPRPKVNPHRTEEIEAEVVIARPDEASQPSTIESVADIPVSVAEKQANPFEVSLVKKAHAAPEEDSNLVQEAREKALRSPGMGDEAMLAVRSNTVAPRESADRQVEPTRYGSEARIGGDRKATNAPLVEKEGAESRQLTARTEEPARLQTPKFFGAHLGTFLDPRKALLGWQYIYRSHSDLLSGLQPRIRRLDLGEKGVRYRLRVTPFVNSAAAQVLCEKLEARGKYCRVTQD